MNGYVFSIPTQKGGVTMAVRKSFPFGSQKLFSGSRPPKTLLTLEALEERELMASNLTASLSEGFLRIDGSHGDDAIILQQEAGRISVMGIPISTTTGLVNQVEAASVVRIEVFGLAGNDFIQLDNGLQKSDESQGVKQMFVGVDGTGQPATIVLINNGDIHARTGAGASPLGNSLAFVRGQVVQWYAGVDMRGEPANHVVMSDGSAYWYNQGAWQQTDSRGVQKMIAGVDSLGRPATMVLFESGDIHVRNGFGNSWLAGASPTTQQIRANAPTENGLIQTPPGAEAIAVPAWVYGGTGNDTLIGGFGNDTLISGGVKDRIYLGGGDEIIEFNPDTVWILEQPADLANLQAQYGFRPEGELLREPGSPNKYFGSSVDPYWYMLIPNGNIYRAVGDSRTFISRVPESVYANPDSLFHAETIAEAELANLQARYGFRFYVQDWNLAEKGWNAKWFVDSHYSWHLITPDGGLYSYGLGVRTFIAKVPQFVYDDPYRLFQAQTVAEANLANLQAKYDFRDEGDFLKYPNRAEKYFGSSNDPYWYVVTPEGDIFRLVNGMREFVTCVPQNVYANPFRLFQAENIAQAQLVSLQAQNGFCGVTADHHFNSKGWQEKWFVNRSASWYLVTANGDLYRYDGSDKRTFLTRVPEAVYQNLDRLFAPDTTRNVGIGKNGTVYWLESNGQFYQAQPGEGKAAGRNDIVAFWVWDGPDGHVFTLDGHNQMWLDGRAIWAGTKDFAIGSDETLYWLSTDGLFQFNRPGDEWKTMDGIVQRFWLWNGHVFTLHSDNMMKRDGYNLWGNTQDFAAAPNGTAYWLGTSGLLQKLEVGGSWRDVAVDVQGFWLWDGHLFTLHHNHMMKRDGTDLWPDTKDFVVAANGTVYWLSTWGLLQRHQVGGAWEVIATDVLSIAANPDGMVRYDSALRAASVPVFSADRTAIVARRQDVVFNPGKWAEDGYKPDHIHQYNSGICTIASALAAGAAAGIDFSSRIQYTGNSQYRVFIYEAGWQTVYFDGTVYDSDLLPLASGVSVQNGQQVPRLANFWPLLFARAYLQYQAHIDWHSDPGSDSSWYGGFLGIRAPWTSPKNANFAVAGGDKNNWDTSEGSAMGHLLDNLRLGSVCTVSTLDPAYGGQPNHSWNWIDRSIGTGHSWAVVGLTQGGDGVWRIQLHNPWGYDSDRGALDGANDGYVTMTWDAFTAHFDTITMVTRAGVSY